MGTVYHTGWTTNTQFTTANMNLPLSELDEVICVDHNICVHCDGQIRYDKTQGKLMWSAPLKVLFNDSSGKIISNITSAADTSITLSDSQFAILDLSTVEGATIASTDCTAVAGTTSSTNIQGKLRCVLGYRNASSDDFFPVNLKPRIEPIISLSPTNTDANSLYSMTLSASNAYFIDAYILAKRTTAQRGMWSIRAGAYHNGASALLSGATWTTLWSTVSNSSYLVTMNSSGNNIEIKVQADATDVNWQAKVNYQEL